MVTCDSQGSSALSKEDLELKAKILKNVYILYRLFDLSTDFYKKEMDRLAEKVYEDISKHPSCQEILDRRGEAMHYLLQISLEGGAIK